MRRWCASLIVISFSSALACGTSKRHDSSPHPPGKGDGSGASTATGGTVDRGGGGDGGAPADAGDDAGEGAGVSTATGGTAGAGGRGASGAGGTQNDAGSGALSGSGTAGASTNPPGAPNRDDHTPPAIVPSCVRPRASDAAPRITSIKVGSSVLRASERDCAWVLGEPLALPLEPDDATTLLFQLDVNGDGIDDLFYGDYSVSDGPASGKPLVRFASRLDGNELTYERTDCETPWAVSNRNYFARDLDADGVLDFVIGGINGVSAVLNTADERPEVLHYDWPNTQGWASILDVAVGDFDHDGRDDVAVGYDRTYDSINVEGGVLLFRDRSAAGTYGEPEVLDHGTTTFGAFSAPPYFPLGYVAAVPTSGSTKALYWLVDDGTQGMTARRYESPTSTGFPIDFPSPSFIAALGYADRFGFAVAGSNGGFRVFDTADSTLVGGFALSNAEHRPDHELGGGLRERQFFLVDLDGDGDEDFFERARPSWATSGELWIEPRRAISTFDPPIKLTATDTSSRWLESPFLRAGSMPGRLVATDGAAAVVPIVCANAEVDGTK